MNVNNNLTLGEKFREAGKIFRRNNESPFCPSLKWK